MTRFLSVFILLVLLTSVFTTQSQIPSIGLLYSDTAVSEGYTLFSPDHNNEVYLINNCGEVINHWSFSEAPGASCYLLKNGNLLRAGKDSLKVLDWNNSVVWKYATTANGIKQHHDIEPLPNGNVICVVSDIYSVAEIIEMGRDSLNIGANLKLDKVVEIQPVGLDSGVVVWEWKVADHLIQDIDSTKANFGVVADHPELIDLNFDNGQHQDYTHFNGIDYNEVLDQVMVTVRHLSELYLIDHSTTTTEAAGHTGGNSGVGGDLMWRWGNPQVYRQGNLLDQKIFRPHDGRWVETGYTDDGKVTVFNNDGDTSASYSAVHLIEPVFTAGAYELTNNKFDPADYDWSWSGSILGDVLDEAKKCGVQALPNGNVIICETSKGRAIELTKDGDVLWVYKNPTGLIIYNQFDTVPSNKNSIFRADKYPVDYVGFVGQDLTPQGIIEDQNSISALCIAAANRVETLKQSNIKIVNPSSNGRIEFSEIISANSVRIADLSGKQVYAKQGFNGKCLNVNLKPAMYIVQLRFTNRVETHKVVVR